MTWAADHWKELFSVGLVAAALLTCTLSPANCPIIGPLTAATIAYLLGRDNGYLKAMNSLQTTDNTSPSQPAVK